MFIVFKFITYADVVIFCCFRFSPWPRSDLFRNISRITMVYVECF